MELEYARSLLWVAIFFAASPAAATLSGTDAVFVVRPAGSVSTVVRQQPGEVLPTDEVLSIEIGVAGGAPVAGVLNVVQEGLLPDVGFDGVYRGLGDVALTNGALTIDTSYLLVDLHAGVYGDPPDAPIEATLAITGSNVIGRVDVQNAAVTVTSSSISELRLRKGEATLQDSSVDALEMSSGEASLALVGSTLGDAASLFIAGDLTLSESSSISTAIFSYYGGDASIDQSALFAEAIWIGDLGQPDATSLACTSSGAVSTALSVEGSNTSFDLGLDCNWLVVGLGLVQDAAVSVEASATLQVGGDFALFGPTAQMDLTGAGTLVQLGGDFGLGRNGSTCGGDPGGPDGVVTVASGAELRIVGQLQLCPGAVVNLEPGGTIRTASIGFGGGTLNQNGGVLIVPEPASALAGCVGLLCTVALRARRRRAAVVQQEPEVQ